MKLINRLTDLFTGSPKDSSILITVQCRRCGEVIQARIDLNNDLSVEYGEGDKDSTYFCRKVLIGKKGCYFSIEVELKFDSRRNLVERQIKGGKFVDT